MTSAIALPRPPGRTKPPTEQWLVCIGVALSLIVVEEIKKLLKVKTDEAPGALPAPAVATA